MLPRQYTDIIGRLDHAHELLHDVKTTLVVMDGKIDTLTEKVNAMAQTQAQLAAQVKTIGDAITKIGTETTTLLQMVTTLQQAVANAPVTPELQAAVDAVAAQAKVVDDLVPDAPPAPTP